MAEDAAEGRDERQAGRELQRRGGGEPAGGCIGEPVADVGEAGQGGDGEGEGGEDARHEGEAQRKPAAVGEEGGRRRLVSCVRGHGEGAREKRWTS